MEDRIDKLLSFLREIEKFKDVKREIYLKDRKENDAEHAWHLAMFVFLFEKDLPKDLDLSKMFKLALMHDLVEIYAGDTFAFDEEGKKTKKAREAEAAGKLFSKLPEDLHEDFDSLFEEWELSESKEALTVHMFDKLQAMLQSASTEGRSWKDNNIGYEQIEEFTSNFFQGKNFEWNEPIIASYQKIMSEIKRLF